MKMKFTQDLAVHTLLWKHKRWIFGFILTVSKQPHIFNKECWCWTEFCSSGQKKSIYDLTSISCKDLLRVSILLVSERNADIKSKKKSHAIDQILVWKLRQEIWFIVWLLLLPPKYVYPNRACRKLSGNFFLINCNIGLIFFKCHFCI